MRAGGKRLRVEDTLLSEAFELTQEVLVVVHDLGFVLLASVIVPLDHLNLFWCRVSILILDVVGSGADLLYRFEVTGPLASHLSDLFRLSHDVLVLLGLFFVDQGGCVAVHFALVDFLLLKEVCGLAVISFALVLIVAVWLWILVLSLRSCLGSIFTLLPGGLVTTTTPFSTPTSFPTTAKRRRCLRA